LFGFVAFDEVAGCFGEEEESDYDYQTPCELDCDRDAVAS
jgi:hypothetical protein